MTASQPRNEQAPAKTVAKPSWTQTFIALTRRGPIHVLLIFLAVLWLTPSFGILITSFRSPADIATSGWWTVFDELGRLNLNNYDEVLRNSQLAPPGITQNFVNTLIITVPSTFLPIFFAALAAYGFAWMHFPFRNTLYLTIIALLIIPLQTTWVPVLRIYNIFGLAGTWPGIWLAHTAYGTPFAIFLLYNFFADLPGEVFDSARVDGASRIDDILSHRAAALYAGAGIAGDFPVCLGLERFVECADFSARLQDDALNRWNTRIAWSIRISVESACRRRLYFDDRATDDLLFAAALFRSWRDRRSSERLMACHTFKLLPPRFGR